MPWCVIGRGGVDVIMSDVLFWFLTGTVVVAGVNKHKLST